MRRPPIETALGAAAVLWAGGPALAQCDLAEIVPGDPSSAKEFGAAAALAGGTDAGIALLGAPGDDAQAVDAGAAYVFEASGGVWSEAAKLQGSDAHAWQRFGSAVALELPSSPALDGARAAIGAPGNQGSPAAYVFERGAGGWSELARVVPANGFAPDSFATALALQGPLLAVGAPLADIGFQANAGKVWIFEESAPGGPWVEVQQLTAGDHLPNDWFGASLALDGDWLAIASVQDSGLFVAQGSVYFFERVNGSFVQRQKVGAVAPESFGKFGSALALRGGRALVGSPYSDAAGVDSGAAYTFALSGATWTLEATLLAGDALPLSLFGASVALSETDTPVALVGSPSHSLAGYDPGTVYAYRLDAGAWSETAAWIPAGAQAAEFHGAAVALAGDLAVAGATLDDAAVPNGGSAHVARLQPALAFAACPEVVGLAAGGAQSFALSFPAWPGRLALVLGSVSGTSPALDLGNGVLLPLVVDAYTLATLSLANQGPFVATLAVLDPLGEHQAALAVPPGTDPALAGLHLDHAALVIEIGATPYVAAASNAGGLDLSP
jgi:hypothetical protein